MQTTRAVRRSSELVRPLGPRIGALLVALLATAVLAAGCGGGEEAQDDGAEEQDTSGQKTEQTANIEDTTVGDERTSGGGSGREVTLRIEGDPGTRFSGTCNVGDEENELSGQVPESFGYDLEGQQLECEIRQEDAGSLEILLTGPGDRVEQQINAPGGTISLAFSENGVSSSTSSSSSSVNQVVSSSSGGSSSSSSVSSR
ncbi:MAG TPA: hypothetical protein VK359_06780 [Rubrobacteraceae bacterium]|nr:hypothetical protein [Rubrobacteraceae bacterium]